MANKYKTPIEEEPEIEEIEEPIEEEIEEEPEEAPKVKKPMSPRLKSVSRGFRDILGGDMLSKKTVIKQLPFLSLLFVFAIAYIYNNNKAEQHLILIEKNKKELIELRYEYISSKADMMDSLKQSIVLKKLEAMGIKESMSPPHKMYINTTKPDKK
jgi:hypothetical protein